MGYLTHTITEVEYMLTLCVRNVDIQKPLCAFQTFTVVSEEAEITEGQQNGGVRHKRTN